MRIVYLLLFLLIGDLASAQSLQQTLEKEMNSLMADEQFKHGILGMYVVDVQSGEKVFEKNAQIGMAPASCLKVVTSVSAFEFLGSQYQYKTYFGMDKPQDGNLIVSGGGDPSLGSWRWADTKEEEVREKIAAILKRQQIKNVKAVYVDDRKFSYQPVPDGWIWQDMGNYYGAGTFGLNWHENQYDLHLASNEEIGSNTIVKFTSPIDLKPNIYNLIKAAGKNTGDNGYIYAAPYSEEIYATGTIPAGEKDFTISGSIPNPPLEFAKIIASICNELAIPVNSTESFSALLKQNKALPLPVRTIDSIVSPTFEKLNYWFLKRSINLYGETFVKTIAVEKGKEGTTENGIALIKEFWKNRGIEKSAIDIIDGSGLSTGNRITANALVTVMLYAKKQKWFSTFYESLPEMNGIKMKDGYINGVRSYTGYIQSKSGKEYCFAMMVNNFQGNASTVRQKMWKILDYLK